MKKAQKKVFHGEEPDSWEKNIGPTPVERVGRVGTKILDYRETTLSKLTNTEAEGHEAHDNYIHTMGAHMLQIQLRDGAGEDKSKMGKARKISPRRIRVNEMEGTTGALMALDLEWDTRGWSDDMIEGGCDTLVYIFQERDPNINQATKDKAALMIGKMLSRHDAAVKYFKKILDLTLNSSVSRLMRGGVSGSTLDLLYIIAAVKEKFHKDISQNGYCAKVFSMMILESKVAAILIQHSWRSSVERVKLRRLLAQAFGEMKTATRKDLPIATSEWENARDMRRTRLSMINSRNVELRQLWRLMHKSNRRMNVGLRGPIHVGATHTTVALDIIRYLVAEQSSPSYSLLSANRLDVIQAHSCILLSVFLSFSSGPFAAHSIRILSECARVWEAMFTMFQTGCTVACLKYMKHLRATRPLLLRNNVLPQKSGKGDESARSRDSGSSSRRSSSGRIRSRRRSSAVVTGDEDIDPGTLADRESYRTSVEMICHLAEHAAGIYQAKQKVTPDGFEVIHPRKKAFADPTRWPIDYLPVLEVVHNPRASGIAAGTSCPVSVMKYLGDTKLVAEIVSAMTDTLDAVMIKALLRCLLTLASCECISVVIEELVLYGGRPVVRLVELLEEGNEEISILSLCLLLQVCTIQAGRDALVVVNIQRHLAPLTRCSATNYARAAYERAVLVSAALCRQDEWWVFDPLDVALQLTDTPDTIRKSVWLDLLRTVKKPPKEVADTLSIADLAVLPTDYEAAKEMSVMAEAVGVRDIADFICHPTDERHFENLPWDESIGSCVILEGLSLNPGTAQSMFNTGTVYFLGRCLYSSRLMFMDKPLSDRMMVLLLKGVTAASHALFNLCSVCYDIKENAESMIVGVRQSSVLDAACYYIGTLAVKHPALDEALFRLQQDMGTSVVSFFGAYASLLLFLRGADSSELAELSSAGCALCELVSKLHVVHGRSLIAWDMLDKLCHLLSRLTVSRSGSFAAVTEWRVIEALRVHLPPPLSGIVIQSVDDELYQEGLGKLTAPYFHLCANLCQMDRGRAAALSEGFLRRSLEKLMIIKGDLETPKQMAGWRRLFEKKTPPTPSTTRKEVNACLHLISQTANFQAPMYGTANDLIFWEEYDVLGVCRDLIAAEECPRCEDTVVMAIKTLRELSKDTSRLSDAFVEIDIIGLIKSQLDLIEDEFMPDSVIEDCIGIVENVAAGFWNDYMEEHINEWRQPLGKITRVKPKFEVLIRDAQWAITKAFNSRAAHTVCKQITVDAISRTSTALATNEKQQEQDAMLAHDSSMNSEFDAVENFAPFEEVHGLSIAVDQSENNDLVDGSFGSFSLNSVGRQTPQPRKKLSPIKSLPLMSPAALKLGPHGAGAANAPRLHTAPAASVEKRRRRLQSGGPGGGGNADEEEEQEDVSQWNESLLEEIVDAAGDSFSSANPGTYEYCGVSSCGSLRLSSLGQTHTHGDMSRIAEREKTASLLKLPVVEAGGLTPAGKLSARDPEYQRRLARQKIAHGFYVPSPRTATAESISNLKSGAGNLLATADEQYNMIPEVLKPGGAPATPVRTPSAKLHKKLTNVPSSPRVDPSLLKDFEDFYSTPRKESVGGMRSQTQHSQHNAVMTPTSSVRGKGNTQQFQEFPLPSPSPVSHKIAGGGGGGAGFWGQHDYDGYDELEKTAIYNAATFGDYGVDVSASKSRMGSRPGTNAVSTLRPLRLSSAISASGGKRKPSTAGMRKAPSTPQPLAVLDVEDLPELSITRPPLPSRNLSRAVVRTGKT